MLKSDFKLSFCVLIWIKKRLKKSMEDLVDKSFAMKGNAYIFLRTFNLKLLNVLDYQALAVIPKLQKLPFPYESLDFLKKLAHKNPF